MLKRRCPFLRFVFEVLSGFKFLSGICELSGKKFDLILTLIIFVVFKRIIGIIWIYNNRTDLCSEVRYKKYKTLFSGFGFRPEISPTAANVSLFFINSSKRLS